MWLVWTGPHDLEVLTDKYIESQPVEYEQVRDVIEEVQSRKVPIFTRVDISEIKISKISLSGLIDIVWDLHEKTRGDPYLKSITFTGASRRARCAWRVVSSLLPKFVSDLIIFSS